MGLAYGTYGISLASHEFLGDDESIILHNDLLRNASTLPNLMTTGYWQNTVGVTAHVYEYRPMVMLSYFLNEHLFGLYPQSFRAVNIFLHGLNAFVVLQLLGRWMTFDAAALAAALFVVLPVHAESVAGITGRSDLLCFFFLLLAWLDLDRARRLTIKNVLLFSMALFTKELASVFPFVWIQGDWTFHPTSRPGVSRLKTFGGLLIVVGIYLVSRVSRPRLYLSAGDDYFSWTLLSHPAVDHGLVSQPPTQQFHSQQGFVRLSLTIIRSFLIRPGAILWRGYFTPPSKT